jgi:hypothetical protein
MTTHRCGSIHRQPLSTIADRVARYVQGHRTPFAVTLDPDGTVTVEGQEGAIESDLVGVYVSGEGLLALSRILIEDLRFEVETRNLAPLRYRSRVQGVLPPALQRGAGHV